ncbi:MAG: DUF4277 domain-containing protein [Spirochaetota bacterium]
MHVSESVPPGLSALSEAEIYTHGYLPLAAAYCRRLGLAELVDRMVPTQMELRPGLVVQAMVLDVLSGRTPLYRVEHFLATQDVELLLGETVPVHAFSDTNLARSLDASAVSYDTTSTSVWGDYRECESDEPPAGPLVTHGHSKDHHPELKQFMTELLCVDRGVPIFGRTLDGNSSDKTSNNAMLSRISQIMAKSGLGPGTFVSRRRQKKLDKAIVGSKASIMAELGRLYPCTSARLTPRWLRFRCKGFRTGCIPLSPPSDLLKSDAGGARR